MRNIIKKFNFIFFLILIQQSSYINFLYASELNKSDKEICKLATINKLPGKHEIQLFKKSAETIEIDKIKCSLQGWKRTFLRTWLRPRMRDTPTADEAIVPLSP